MQNLAIRLAWIGIALGIVAITLSGPVFTFMLAAHRAMDALWANPTFLMNPDGVVSVQLHVNLEI